MDVTAIDLTIAPSGRIDRGLDCGIVGGVFASTGGSDKMDLPAEDT